jgi:hypothetical protein
MERLRALIEELVTIQRAMGDASQAARQDPARRPELSAMRKRYAAHIVAVSQAIESDPQLAADDELARMFRGRFSEMRSGIALHQAKWPAVLIDGSDPEFNQSAAAIIARNRAFGQWALEVLK